MLKPPLTWFSFFLFLPLVFSFPCVTTIRYGSPTDRPRFWHKAITSKSPGPRRSTLVLSLQLTSAIFLPVQVKDATPSPRLVPCSSYDRCVLPGKLILQEAGRILVVPVRSAQGKPGCFLKGLGAALHRIEALLTKMADLPV